MFHNFKCAFTSRSLFFESTKRTAFGFSGLGPTRDAKLQNAIITQEATIISCFLIIDHFTVVGLVTWPLNGSEAGVDLVLIQTSLLLLCKSSCSHAN